MEILKAQRVAEAERKAEEQAAEKQQASAQLLDKALGTLNEMPQAEKKAWLAQASKAAGDLVS